MTDDKSVAGMAGRPLRAAVIGAGPAGIYSADILLQQLQQKGPDLGLPAEAYVDIFEKLPVPFGLVRYGVAPDHPAIRFITAALDKTLSNPHIRLFADVEFGRDITLEDLQGYYDAVIFSTGAVDDRPLDIEGRSLRGVYGAARFVEWYDGYPGTPPVWPLDAETVAVIGGGNVAMDVARMLMRYPDDLLGTDIPQNVYDGLAANRARDIHVFVRRGAVQAKFSVQELRELEKLPGVRIIVDRKDFDIDDAVMREASKDKLTRQMIDELFAVRDLAEHMAGPDGAEAGPGPGSGTGFEGKPAKRRCYLHFNSNPVQILGDSGKVQAVRIERTVTAADGVMAGTGEYTDYPVGTVYHAIGYKPAEISGIPYDEVRYTLKNKNGRIISGNIPDASDAAEAGSGPGILPFVYTSGWAKRGPVGLIGSTKSDALETVGNILEDWARAAQAGQLRAEDGAGSADKPDTIGQLLASRGISPLDYDAWHRIDACEKAEGAKAGRDRIKITDAEVMRSCGSQPAERKGYYE